MMESASSRTSVKLFVLLSLVLGSSAREVARVQSWKQCTKCDGSGKRGLLGPRGLRFWETCFGAFTCSRCHGNGGWFEYDIEMPCKEGKLHDHGQLKRYGKYSYNNKGLKLEQALKFEDLVFTDYFISSFKDFAKTCKKNHMHVEWMPITKDSLKREVIEWVLIDDGSQFRVDSDKDIEGRKTKYDYIGKKGEKKTAFAPWGRTHPTQTICTRESRVPHEKSYICCQIIPNRGVGDRDVPDAAGDACRTIKTFMTKSNRDRIKTLWKAIGKQAITMAKESNYNHPLQIWTVGGSFGWLHVKMCRDFSAKSPAHKGWKSQVKTRYANCHQHWWKL